MLLLGLAAAVSVQIVGALLVLSLLVTPAAAALRVSSSPLLVPILSVLRCRLDRGRHPARLGRLDPDQPYVTTISFAIWVVCTLIARVRRRVETAGSPAAVAA